MSIIAPARRILTGHPSVWLDGRRRASIRPIEPRDAVGIASLYRSLSPESRRRRFLGCRGPSAVELPRTDPRDRGLVAEMVEPGPRDGAIVGHVAILPFGEGRAEVSFVVADDLQRRGIGTALMREALARGSSLGIVQLEATTFAENVAMRRILLNAGCPVERDVIDAGVEEVVIRIPTDAVAGTDWRKEQ